MEAMSLTETDMYASNDNERQHTPRKGKQAAEQGNLKSERGCERRYRARTLEKLSELTGGWAFTEALAAKTAVPADER
jgi:hypothetical protein